MIAVASLAPCEKARAIVLLVGAVLALEPIPVAPRVV